MYLIAYGLALIGAFCYYKANGELSEKNKESRGNLFNFGFFVTRSDYTAKGWIYFIVGVSSMICASLVGFADILIK